MTLDDRDPAADAVTAREHETEAGELTPSDALTATSGRARTDTFALVFPETESRLFSEDVFFSSLIQGVSEGLDRAKRQLVLMLAPDPAAHARIEGYVTAGHVDGVIIASIHGPDSMPRKLQEARVPVVAIGQPLAPSSVPHVDVDHRAATEKAASYLLASGRRHIAHIAAPQDMNAGVDRQAGYLAALERTGTRAMIAIGDFTRESGARAMQELLVSAAKIDSVVVASDLMAVGAIEAIHHAGLQVPKDIAIIGFDDARFARTTDPPLTTVRQPVFELGAAAARQVVAIADGEPVQQSIMLPTEIVIRESA